MYDSVRYTAYLACGILLSMFESCVPCPGSCRPPPPLHSPPSSSSQLYSSAAPIENSHARGGRGTSPYTLQHLTFNYVLQCQISIPTYIPSSSTSFILSPIYSRIQIPISINSSIIIKCHRYPYFSRPNCVISIEMYQKHFLFLFLFLYFYQ